MTDKQFLERIVCMYRTKYGYLLYPKFRKIIRGHIRNAKALSGKDLDNMCHQ